MPSRRRSAGAGARGGRTRLKVLGALVGVPLSAALVSTAFFRWDLSGQGPLLVPRFPLERFLAELPGHLPWLVPFILLSGALIPLRALQWGRTLPRRVPYRERYHLVAIGAFVHNALPGKLGELFRAFLMARTQGLPFLQTLGSVAVCKLLEFAALMGLVALSFLGPFGAALERFRGPLRAAVGVCLALVVLVVALAHWAAPLARRLQAAHRAPRLRGFLEHLSEGFGTARSLRGMLAAFALSVPPVLASAVAYGLALRGLHIPAGLYGGAVVLGAIALGQAAPGVPAGMGLYYLVTSWAARSLGASEPDAAAFATLTHLSTVLAQLSVGALSVHVRGLRLRDLRRGGSLAKEAAGEALHESVEPARA